MSAYGRSRLCVATLVVALAGACSSDSTTRSDPAASADAPRSAAAGASGPTDPPTDGPSAGDAGAPEDAGCAPLASGPPTGAWLGVSLDGAELQLSTYADHLGDPPAVVVAFAELPLRSVDVANVDDVVEYVADSGSAVLLTLEPMRGLAAVDDQALTTLVGHLRRWNAAGTPVVVRYAHEMNGSWYAWGQQPRRYVGAFRRLARAVHRGAPRSQTMWAPSYGGGYPFVGGRFAARPGSTAAAVLDTDASGALDPADDAYAPYYPGDAAVDWVGMSLYHWGNVYPWGENEVAYPDKVAAQLEGTYAGPGVDERVVPDFYGEYAVRRDQPLAIAETGALYAEGRGGADELRLKRNWWRQVLAPDLLRRLPQLRMVNWFEWDKYEPEVSGEVSWSVTGDPVLRAAFRGDLPRWVRLGRTPSC